MHRTIWLTPSITAAHAIAIVALCATEAPQLLERLAELIAADLCSLDAVTATTVTVTKLRPPVAADLATSAVRITRRRPA